MHVIITANQRLARALKVKHPHVYFFEDFMLKFFPSEKTVVSSTDEYHLWEQAVQIQGEMSWLQPKTIALLKETDNLTVAYGIEAADLDPDKAGAFLRLQAWVESFYQQHGCLSFQRYLRQQVMCPLAEPPPFRSLDWVGFITRYPRHEQIQQWLGQQGVVSRYVEQQGGVSHCAKMHYPQPQDELIAAAHFAKMSLAQGKSVAVLVPALEACRDLLDYHFADVLDESQLSTEKRSYYFSLGKPLAQTALLQSLQKSFYWLRPTCSFHDLTAVLTEPFLCADEQALYDNSIFLAYLRKKEQYFLTRSAIIQHEKTPEKLRQLLQAIEAMPLHERSLSAWCEFLQEWIKMLQWPGAHWCNDSVLQMLQQCQLAVKALQLSVLNDATMELEKFLSLLKNTMAATRFEEKRQYPSIQIMGLLESIGLAHDAVWVVGMNQEQYPVQSAPNPFIPLALQIQKGMPNCHPEWAAAVCSKVLDAVRATNKSVVFSYAVQASDGLPLHPSVLIDAVEARAVAIHTAPTRFQRIRQHYWLEDYTLQQGARLPLGEVKGGAKVLSDHYQCPHRSYLKYRLAVSPVPRIRQGIHAKERGILMHRLLECIYQRVHVQQDLARLSTDFMQQCIRQVLASSACQLSSTEKNIEAARLQQLLEQVLAFEKDRKTFQVKALEHSVSVDVRGNVLRLKIDRMDLIEGGVALLDYKTGQVASLTHPIEDFQLPLYVLAQQQMPVGIGFISIKKQKIAFHGIGVCDDPVFERLEPLAWQQYLTDAQQAVMTVMQSFQAGDAALQPRHGKLTCERCEFHKSCRIQEGGFND